MGLLDALRTGRSGLRVASTGLSVTGHNVTNATTEGYTRRTLQSTMADPVTRSGLLLGQGARATGVASSSDRFVNASLVDAQGDQSRSAATEETLTAVESVFSLESAGGIATTWSDFRSLASDPSDLSRRTEAVGAAEALTGSVRDTSARLTATLDAIQEEFAAAMDRINASFEAIASLNGQIASSSGVSGGGTPPTS